MSILTVKNMNHGFGDRAIFEDVSFRLLKGEHVGFVGANGEGKSTFMNIITNKLMPDEGQVIWSNNVRVGYMDQHAALEKGQSIRDALRDAFKYLFDLETEMNSLYEKMGDCTPEELEKMLERTAVIQDLLDHNGFYIIDAKVEEVAKGLGLLDLGLDRDVDDLSGGQRTKILLGKLLLQNPDILLLDEPTNHLDLEAIEWLEEYLKSYKGTILVISHDRFFLDSVTNRTFQVINGHVNCYNASYTKFLELREKDYESQLKAYNLQQAEIKRQEAIIEKFRSFNREKSIRAAESREKALDRMEKIDAPDEEKGPAKIKFETSVKSGYDVLHAENLSKSFGDKHLFSNLSLDLKRGEKIALIGENGRGKTTFFNILMDKIKPDSGVKVLGTNVNIGYYDQEQSNLNLDKTILDEVWDDFPEMTTTELRTALGCFLFRNDEVFKEINKLSGGERCRVNLLKLMLSKSNLLLLDEPTNHLDIPSREALEDAILSYDGTLIVISHDRYFLNKVINRILELQEDGAHEYLGNYNYYVEKKKNPLRFETYEGTANGKTKTAIKDEKKKNPYKSTE